MLVLVASWVVVASQHVARRHPRVLSSGRSQDRLVEPTGPAAIISRPYDTLRTCLPARMLACSHARLPSASLGSITLRAKACLNAVILTFALPARKSGSLLGSVGLWALLICACFAAQHCASSWCSSSSA